MEIVPRTEINKLAILLDNDNELETIYRATLKSAVQYALMYSRSGNERDYAKLEEMRNISNIIHDYRAERDNHDRIN